MDGDSVNVDEVLAVGDAEFQKKCLGKMNDIRAQENRTVLFVSHNLISVQTLCESGVLIQDGLVSYQGLVEDVVGEYLKTITDLAACDLASRTDRKGKGLSRLQRIELSNGKPGAVDQLTTGQSAVVRFVLTQVLPNTNCVFTIYDDQGLPVTNFNSRVRSSNDTFMDDSESVLSCHIDRLPLVPGRYRINVAISSDHGLEDHVESALSFTVLPGIFAGRPVNRDSGFGRTYVDHRWLLPKK